MTQPEPMVDEAVQRRIAAIVETEDQLLRQLSRLERSLKVYRRIAIAAVALVVAMPLLWMVAPLHARRVVVRELVVDGEGDAKIVARADGDRTSLELFRDKKSQVEIVADGSSNRVHLASFTGKGEGVTIESRQEATELRVQHDRFSQDPERSLVRLVSDETAGRVEVLGPRKSVVFGGAVPTLELSTAAGKVVAMNGEELTLRIERGKQGYVELGAMKDGPKLVIAKDDDKATIGANATNAFFELGAGDKHVLMAANDKGEGPRFSMTDPQFGLVADKAGIFVRDRSDAKREAKLVAAGIEVPKK